MIATEVMKTKLTLKYQNDDGSYTFTNIDTTSSDNDIMTVAEVINSLQEKSVEKVYKVVETQLKDN